MLGLIFVFGLLAFICLKALQHPAYGIIGFYSFVTLDPSWNWRWALPSGIEYQNYIVIATFLGWAFSGFRITSQSKASKLGITLVIAFYLWSWICTFQSLAPPSSYRFMEYLGKVLLMFVVGLLTIDTPKKLLLLLLFALLGQCYNAYQINLDYWQTGVAKWAHVAWGSNNVDNNGYQLLTLPMIGVALGFFCSTAEPKRKIAFMIMALLMAHQIMLSYSRGAMVGGLVMIAATLFLSPRGKRTAPYLVIALLLGLILSGESVVREFKTIFAEGQARDASAESRFHLWKAGLRITMDYPIFGTGPEAARTLVATDAYYDGEVRTGNKALHNLYFDISTGTGIPGFLLFMFFTALPIWLSTKLLKFSRLGTVGKLISLTVLYGFIGYSAGSMFSSAPLCETSYVLVLAGYCVSNFEYQTSGGRIFNESHSVPLF